VLEDGSTFHGHRIGHHDEAWGEVVFNTSMTGYQEMLTDPSYAGQILLLTYPLIGNYGIEPPIDESAQIQVRGLIVRSDCETPSHPHNGITLHEYLLAGAVPGLAGIDTRAVTRRIRDKGVMQGLIVGLDDIEAAKTRLADLPAYDSQDFAGTVGTDRAYDWVNGPVTVGAADGKHHIVVLDEGLKYNILRLLTKRDCRVTAVPPMTSAEDILALKPNGVLLSPGPGDPVHRTVQVDTAKALIGRVPVMGICLGHQVIGRALGAETYKLKFGHRGGNHPVKELATGRVSITAQNHGYALDADGLETGAEVSHINLHDNTVEGLTHRKHPIVSIQYHSEASPGPLDNAHVFDRFLDLVRDYPSS
jgi:carbamoyl-phosphate synthase small subunit